MIRAAEAGEDAGAPVSAGPAVSAGAAGSSRVQAAAAALAAPSSASYSRRVIRRRFSIDIVSPWGRALRGVGTAAATLAIPLRTQPERTVGACTAGIVTGGWQIARSVGTITCMHTRSEFMHSPRAALTAALAFALAGMPAAAGAQDDRNGFYAGLQLGIANASVIQSSNGGVNHPTRCDVLLYTPSVSPPANDPACLNNTPAIISSNEFDPSAGVASGLMVGYTTGGLRFEVEYLHRHAGDDSSPVGGTTSAALQGKTSEWSTDEPPHEWIGDFTAHQVFANAYYDFLNDTNWTPYAGVGIGWAVTNLSYYAQFIRKPEAEYLQVEFDPDWPEAAKRAAAGTASILDRKVGGNVFGFQVLAGIDYALSERTALGMAYRWARFDHIEHDATWNVIRSHAPVQADGVTPFTADLEFAGSGYQALTINLKYLF